MRSENTFEAGRKPSTAWLTNKHSDVLRAVGSEDLHSRLAGESDAASSPALPRVPDGDGDARVEAPRPRPGCAGKAEGRSDERAVAIETARSLVGLIQYYEDTSRTIATRPSTSSSRSTPRGECWRSPEDEWLARELVRE
jgi:hypothetical protein